ncbi:MAG: hypothetical protein ACI81P_002483 [Neolewinella sp.]
MFAPANTALPLATCKGDPLGSLVLANVFTSCSRRELPAICYVHLKDQKITTVNISVYLCTLKQGVSRFT